MKYTICVLMCYLFSMSVLVNGVSAVQPVGSVLALSGLDQIPGSDPISLIPLPGPDMILVGELPDNIPSAILRVKAVDLTVQEVRILQVFVFDRLNKKLVLIE